MQNCLGKVKNKGLVYLPFHRYLWCKQGYYSGFDYCYKLIVTLGTLHRVIHNKGAICDLPCYPTYYSNVFTKYIP